jgi:hypothetical protein
MADVVIGIGIPSGLISPLARGRREQVRTPPSNAELRHSPQPVGGIDIFHKYE